MNNQSQETVVTLYNVGARRMTAVAAAPGLRCYVKNGSHYTYWLGKDGSYSCNLLLVCNVWKASVYPPP